MDYIEREIDQQTIERLLTIYDAIDRGRAYLQDRAQRKAARSVRSQGRRH